MTEENLNEEESNFKVADRRKFNVDGSLREGVVIEEPKPQSVSAPTQPNEKLSTTKANPPDLLKEQADNSFASLESDFPEDSPDADAGEELLDESNIPGAENPASFANFLLSLASQAAAAMGLTENPMTGGRRADLETSRYWLEVLAMLHEKTKGNLHSQEQKLFDGLLSDLRMQFVQLARVAEAQMKKQEEELLKNAAQKFSGKDILGR